MKKTTVRSRIFIPVFFCLIVYLSQMFPYMHIHHEHDGESSQLLVSYHVEKTDFTNTNDHEHDHGHHHTTDHDADSHQHSFSDFLGWHFLRTQNVTHHSVLSKLTIKSESININIEGSYQYINAKTNEFFASVIISTPIIRGPPVLKSC